MKTKNLILFPALILIPSLIMIFGCGSDDADPVVPPPAGVSIGPAGGTVASKDGHAELVIPPDALGQETTVLLETAALPSSGTGLIPDRFYHLHLDKGSFLKDVTVSISYDPGQVPAGVEEGNMLMYSLEDTLWEELAGCVVDTVVHSLSGVIQGTGPGAIRSKDDLIDRSLGLGRLITCSLPAGSVTAFLTTSELTENTCFTIPAYPLQTQKVTISEDGRFLTFMDITGDREICTATGTKEMTIPVDIANDCWAHITSSFYIIFSDPDHFRATYRVVSDYTSTCSAEDCEYEFEITGVR